MDWLAPENDPAVKVREIEYYNILIVDDEEDVHKTTKLTMKNFQFEGRKMRFFSAYSAQQARQLLNAGTHYSLILLDVLMETEHAGLDFVDYIRKQLKNSFTRIRLTTGVPLDSTIMRNFDIDGYSIKAGTTKQDLEYGFYSSLRAYRDILKVQKHNQALQQVIASIACINQVQDRQHFSNILLAQIKLLLKCSSSMVRVVNQEAFVIKQVKSSLSMFSNDIQGLKILSLRDIKRLPPQEKQLFENALHSACQFQSDCYYVCYHHCLRGYDTICAFETNFGLAADDVYLLDLLIKNIVISYEKLVPNE